jgi:hypothetical protein
MKLPRRRSPLVLLRKKYGGIMETGQGISCSINLQEPGKALGIDWR